MLSKMNTIRIVPDQELSQWIRSECGEAVSNGIDLNSDRYLSLLGECSSLHPTYSDDNKHRWAAYTAFMESRKSAPVSRKFSDVLSDNQLVWVWRIAVLALLAVIAVEGIF